MPLASSQHLLSILAAALPDVTGSPGLAVLRRLRQSLNRSAGDAPSHPPRAGCTIGDGRSKDLPVFTCCSLTEGGTRLSACGTHRRLLRSHSPPTRMGHASPIPHGPPTHHSSRWPTAPAPHPLGSRR